MKTFDKGGQPIGSTLYDMALSPDGTIALLGSDPYDKRIFLWDIEKWQPQRIIDQRITVCRAAFSPDGRHAATTALHGEVLVWDLSEDKVLRAMKMPSIIVRLMFSPDGRRLTAAGGFTEIPVWDVATGNEAQRLTGHQGNIGVWGAVFLPDNRRLVSGGADGALRIWNLDSGESIHVLPHPDWIWAVAVSPDGRRILSGTGGGFDGDPIQMDYLRSADNCLRLFDADSGLLTQTLTGHEHMVMSVAFSPDGRRAASGGYDHTVRLWDLERGTELASFEGESWVTIVHFLPDGRHILCGGGASRKNKTWLGIPNERVRLFRIDVADTATDRE